MSYLLDINVISELVHIEPDKNVLTWFSAIPNTALYISALTLGEIRKGVEKIQNTKRKELLRAWLEHELPDQFSGRILPIDEAVANKWGWLQSQMKRTLPAIDALIAATALHYDLRLVTRNAKDFEHSLLEIVNPWN